MYGRRLWLNALDLTRFAHIAPTNDRAWSELGRIDVVVSNAGYRLLGAAEEATDEQVRHQLDTNLLGSIQLVRSALPHLRAQGGGRILQISSLGGQVTILGEFVVPRDEVGIGGFIETVAQEVAVFEIGAPLSNQEAPEPVSAIGAPCSPSPSLPMTPLRPAGSTESPRIVAGLTGDPAKMIATVFDVAYCPPMMRYRTDQSATNLKHCSG